MMDKHERSKSKRTQKNVIFLGELYLETTLSQIVFFFL